MSSQQERRGAPRGWAEVPVQVQCGESSAIAQLRSLSRLGALLEGGEPHAIGTRVDLTLELPGTGEKLHIKGQVIRATPSTAGYGVAIHFAPMPPATMARIDAFVALHPTE